MFVAQVIQISWFFSCCRLESLFSKFTFIPTRTPVTYVQSVPPLGRHRYAAILSMTLTIAQIHVHLERSIQYDSIQHLYEMFMYQQDYPIFLMIIFQHFQKVFKYSISLMYQILSQ